MCAEYMHACTIAAVFFTGRNFIKKLVFHENAIVNNFLNKIATYHYILNKLQDIESIHTVIMTL